MVTTLFAWRVEFLSLVKKTKNWQKRSKDGTSKKWWNDVEERHR